MKCSLCLNEKLSRVHDAKELPIFQNKVYATIQDAKNILKGNVRLLLCHRCGFVFNAEFNDQLMNYDSQYQNEQAYSLFFQNYLMDIISLLKQKKLQEKKVVEIGCGKGYFLSLLRANGFDAIGFDPAYTGKESYVIKDYFTEKHSHLDAGLIVLRHTLEHIKEPLNFLANIAKAVNNCASIYIEVPSFEWIIGKNAFWDIFYEHCNYFTFNSLSRLFKTSESGVLFGGQYMYLIADLKHLNKQAFSSNNNEYDLDFSRMIESYKLYKEYVRKNTGMFVWGAGAKGATFVNMTDPDRQYISAVIDVNPEKQGKYIAGSGHAIISPDKLNKESKEKVKVILVMNDNYYNEIQMVINSQKFKLCTLGDVS